VGVRFGNTEEQLKTQAGCPVEKKGLRRRDGHYASLHKRWGLVDVYGGGEDEGIGGGWERGSSWQIRGGD